MLEAKKKLFFATAAATTAAATTAAAAPSALLLLLLFVYCSSFCGAFYFDSVVDEVSKYWNACLLVLRIWFASEKRSERTFFLHAIQTDTSILGT